MKGPRKGTTQNGARRIINHHVAREHEAGPDPKLSSTALSLMALYLYPRNGDGL